MGGGAVVFQTHGNLGLRIGALGDGMHLIQLQGGLMRHQLPNGPKGGIHGARACALGFLDLAVDGQGQTNLWPIRGAAGDVQTVQADGLIRLTPLRIHQSNQVFIKNLFFLIGDGFKTGEGLR